MISDLKKDLRQKLKTLRSQIEPGTCGEVIRDSFLKVVKPAEGAVVATYAPVGSELSVEKLNRALGYSGYKLCLPCIGDDGLVFREWGINTEMTTNKFGISEPNQKSEIRNPKYIIIPVLGFNAKKYRIGYGGGYYDRTLKNSDALKVGVAYAAQEVTEDFQEAHDVPLDMIITEEKIFK